MPGPVFRHEMFSIGRRSRYIVVRTFIGLLLLIFICFTYWITLETASWGGSDRKELSISTMSNVLAGFYLTFAWGTLLGVIGITPSIAAGAIATERERRTIEYLFTTDLSNREIVLDKLLAKLLTIAQMVLATLPILAIMRLMGGLPGELLLWHFAVLASTAILATSIALITSTWSNNSRTAISNAYGGVFLWMVWGPLTFILSEAIRWYLPAISGRFLDPVSEALLFINPIAALTRFGGMVNSSLGIGLDTNYLAMHCLAQVGLAVVLLTITIVSVRRVHIRSLGKVAKSMSSSAKVKKRRSPFETMPMLWKEMFTASEKVTTGNRLKKIVIGLVLLMFLVPLSIQFWLAITAWENFSTEQFFASTMTMSGFLGSFIMLGIAGRAAGLIPHERERETWLSLMSTPMSAREIIYAKIWGNLYAYRWGLGLLLLFPLVGILLKPESLITLLLLTAILSVIAFAVTAFAIRLSLSMKSSSKATTSAVAALLFIGGGYLIFIGPFLAMAGAGDEGIIFLAPCIPLLLTCPYMFLELMGIQGEMIVAFVLGIIGYAVFGAIMTHSSIDRFDGIEGRAPESAIDAYQKQKANSPSDGKLAST